jgi:hypothetical protein
LFLNLTVPNLPGVSNEKEAMFVESIVMRLLVAGNQYVRKLLLYYCCC